MRRAWTTALAAAMCLGTFGCDEGGAPRTSDGGPGIGSATGDGGSTGKADDGSDDPGPASSDGTSGGDDDGDDTATDPTGAPTFDVGNGDGTTGVVPEEGCSKVDFLFVIDNSPSMRPEQEALVSSFPGFMETISSTLNASSDYHIMVVDTDAGDRCESSCSDSLCTDPVAGDYACTTQFDTCDHTMGAGKVHPAGEGASNELCDLTGGNRYIVESEANLTGSFACTATVGLAGHPSERPMDAMVAAISPELNGAGACNDGFLRDDAILVVTFISDDPNYEDAGTPQDWYDTVVEAKNGDASAVVMLGMTANEQGCGNNDSDSGAHWVEFVQMWNDRGLLGSVCEEDFTPFFQQAVDIIDVTCDEFNPPG